MFKTLINIIISPKDAFRSIQEKPTVLFPFLLLLLVLAFTQFWVMNTIDFDYFIDQTVEQAAAQNNMPESQIREGMKFMTPMVMGGIGAVTVVAMVSLIFIIYAAWLNLMAKLSDDRYRFKHFFSLMCWTAMPALFTALASILNTLLSATGEFTQQQLNPLSLNNLLFNTTGPYASLLNAIDPMAIWGYALIFLGYKYLTGSTAGKAAAISLAPVVVIFGGWALIIMLRMS